MSEPQEEKNESYERARSDFDRLRIEDKAVFLVEATVSTVARGIEELGRTLAREIDHLFQQLEEEEEEEVEEPAPAPDVPPVAPDMPPMGTAEETDATDLPGKGPKPPRPKPKGPGPEMPPL
jgi:hypothetical protein